MHFHFDMVALTVYLKQYGSKATEERTHYNLLGRLAPD